MTGAAGFVRALLDPSQSVPAGLVAPGGRPAGRRFDVYRNNVANSLTVALRTAFPAVERLLGEEYFTALAGVYLRAHPPRSRLMMLYGESFAAFIAGFAPLSHLPWLADVARLEQALRESYHAADAAPISAERLAGLPPKTLLTGRLVLAPALRLLRAEGPAHAIWSANLRDTPPPRTMRPEAVLILRPGFDPEPQVIPQAMAEFLEQSLQGQLVGLAMDRAGAEFDLGTCLATLLAGGGLVDIEEN
jgi:hypothetical protein